VPVSKSIKELIQGLIRELPTADAAEASRIKDRIKDLKKLEKEHDHP
jgi:hypothetical protein